MLHHALPLKSSPPLVPVDDFAPKHGALPCSVLDACQRCTSLCRWQASAEAGKKGPGSRPTARTPLRSRSRLETLIDDYSHYPLQVLGLGKRKGVTVALAWTQVVYQAVGVVYLDRVQRNAVGVEKVRP